MRLFFSRREIPVSLYQYLILKSLKGGKEVYGLDLMHSITKAASISYSPICFTVGSFYSDLKSLRKRGLISSIEKGPYAGGLRRQYYFLTDRGREEVQKIESLFGLLSIAPSVTYLPGGMG